MNNIIPIQTKVPGSTSRFKRGLIVFLAILGMLTLGLGSATAAEPQPRKRPTQTTGEGRETGGGGTPAGGKVSCAALRQQVAASYASAGFNSQMAKAAGTRAEKECQSGRLSQ